MIKDSFYEDKLKEIATLEIETREYSPVESVFNINLNTREVDVPAEFRELAVYYDSNAETVWFAVDRYFDGKDLDTVRYAIQYSRDGKRGLLPITTKSLYLINEEDTEQKGLLLGWSVPIDVTDYIGPVTFQVRFFTIDEENGTVDITFSTKPFVCYISEGEYVTDDDEYLGSPPKDSLNELVSRVEALYKNDTATGIKYDNISEDTLPTLNGVKVKGRLNTNAEEAKKYGTDQIRISYNDLSNIPKINGKQLVGNLSDADLGIKVEVDQEVLDNSENPVSGNAVYDKFIEVIGDTDTKFSAVNSQISALWEELDGMTFIPLSIVSFEQLYGLAEKGSTVDSVDFEWEIGGTPTYIDINATNMSLGSTTGTVPGPYVEDTTFILTAKDKKENVAKKETELVFTYKAYHGAKGKPPTYDAAFIKTLIGELQTSRATTIDVNAGGSQHIYYAIPTSYGDCKFMSGGFEGGFKKVQTTSVENQYGVSADYDIWESDYAGLGQTIVIVS